MEFLKGTTGLIYLFGLLAIGFSLEMLFPWRRIEKINIIRLLRNASMAVYGVIILSLLPVMSAYGASLIAQTQNIGLMNIMPVPLWAQLLVALLVADLLAYGQHRALHKWYFLWRLHRVHHSDHHVDASTSLRFHPFEALARALSEFPIVLIIGLPPEGILFSFAVQAFSNTLTHTNIGLPPAIARVMSIIFITPQLHKLHHSTAPGHQYSNFSTVFAIWDRMFKTFTPSHHLTKEAVFGLEGPEKIDHESFGTLISDPFRRPENAAIPRPNNAHTTPPE